MVKSGVWEVGSRFKGKVEVIWKVHKKRGTASTKVKGKKEWSMLRESHRVHKASMDNEWADKEIRKEVSESQITKNSQT